MRSAERLSPRLTEQHGWWPPLLAAAAVALWLRPLIPPGETRYIDVAWEMWAQGSFLLPILNAAPYSDKPPLLFWLIHAGWAVFGVNEWWPRLLPAIQVIVNTYLTGLLARRLWPGLPRLPEVAMWMLAGTLAWMCFASLLLFDMLLACWTLLALLALERAAATAALRWFLLYALCVTLGILTKGPVIFLHVVPAALFGPWWSGTGTVHAVRWYALIMLALVAGTLLAGAWILPAALTGGPSYTEQILWHQSADRVTGSLAHARPWWFYFLAFPALALPWVLLPPAWRGLESVWRGTDRGVRFLLSGLLPAFVIFSAIGGKQLHYLLPWLPGEMLLLAVGLQKATQAQPRVELLVAALFWAGLTIAIGVLIWRLGGAGGGPNGFWSLAPPLLLVLTGTLTRWWRGDLLRATRHVVYAGGLTGACLVVAAFGGVVRDNYDVRPAARVVAAAARRGAPLASVSGYNGEFGFYARLIQPVLDIGEAENVVQWCARNPAGLVIDRGQRASPPRSGAMPVYSHLYRGGVLRLWDCRKSA